tara:strand:- start:3628 stop:3873 length:246 start_codon:yes stop_codon:yes gene_type:complete
MEDIIIKDNLEFIQIPRPLRKQRLIWEAEALQDGQIGEENYTKDIKPYYRDVCLNRYFCDDYKWRIVQCRYTKEISCEVSD